MNSRTKPSTRAAAARVLLVDDEPKLRESIAEGLRLENWTVVTADTGAHAIQLIAREPFDLVVLDWMLPDLDGMDVLQKIRDRDRRLPVLMMTARNTRADQLVAFDNGATDFVGKPFAFADLVARCRALLMPAHSRDDHLHHGELELDLAARALRSRGAEVKLSDIETAIVEFLLRHPHDIVTLDLLTREVWKEEAVSGSLQPVVETQMRRLNHKILNTLGVQLVRTVPGIGFALERGAFSASRIGV